MNSLSLRNLLHVAVNQRALCGLTGTPCAPGDRGIELSHLLKLYPDPETTGIKVGETLVEGKPVVSEREDIYREIDIDVDIDIDIVDR